MDILALCSLLLKKPRDTTLKEKKRFGFKTALSQSGSLKNVPAICSTLPCFFVWMCLWHQRGGVFLSGTRCMELNNWSLNLLWKGCDCSCRPTPFFLRRKKPEARSGEVICTQSRSWPRERQGYDLSTPRPALSWNMQCFVPISNSAATLIHAGSCSAPSNSLCPLVHKERGAHAKFCLRSFPTWLQILSCSPPATSPFSEP